MQIGWSAVSPSVKGLLFQAIERNAKDFIPVNLTYIDYG
jgi:hypothetical protein